MTRQHYWIQRFTDLGAFWKHDENPKRPHALLTKGGHSNGFFNWSMVAQHPRVARAAALELANKVIDQTESDYLGVMNRVIAPGYGACTLADRLTESILDLTDAHILSGFTEKLPEGEMSVARFDIVGQHILMGDDTISTGGSVEKSILEAESKGAKVLPVIFCICNRSGMTHIGDRLIIPLIEVPMQNWKPEECPLCMAGSEAIRPKKENWVRLTATY